jgi:hypothetical protein
MLLSPRQLDMWNSLKLLDQYEGNIQAVPVKIPTYANVPSYLSDILRYLISRIS